MGLDNILEAVKVLDAADGEGKKALLHCSFGNNRRRTVAECFHFSRTGSHQVYFSPIQVNSATIEWQMARKCARAVILGCSRRAITHSSTQNRRETTAGEE